jgi:hypothetical protein
MENVPTPAEELRLLDRELAQLDARRAHLLARRAWLAGVLAQRSAPPAPSAPPWPAPLSSAPPVRRPEAAPPSVQNLLLALGGVLLAVAAIAFTVVSWGSLGIGGRSAVLGVVTLGALAVPAVLLRRGLRSTAESVGALALVLTVLDAYALHRVALPATDGAAYAAFASAALAALWTAYGLVLRERLWLALPAAVVAGQFPLLLSALATEASPVLLTAALLATGAGDAVLALRMRGGRRSVAYTAAGGAGVMGGWGLLSALWLSLDAGTLGAATRSSVLLLAAAAIALVTAWRLARLVSSTADRASAAAGSGPAAAGAGGGNAPLVRGLAAVGGAAEIAAVGGVLRSVLPGHWAVVGYLASAVALLVAVRTSLPDALRRGLVGAAAAVHGLAVLTALPGVAVSLAGPVTWAGDAWSGAPDGARWLDVPWPGTAATPVVLGIVAVVLALTPRFAAGLGPAPGRADEAGTQRHAAMAGALALLWATAVVLPAALRLPYAVALLLHTALTAVTLGAGVVALRRGRSRATVGATALACALGSAVSVSFLALAERASTMAVLGVLLTLCTGASVAFGGRTTSGGSGVAAEWPDIGSVPGPAADRTRLPRGGKGLPSEVGQPARLLRLAQSVTAGTAVVFATAFTTAVAVASELPLHHVALTLLLVPAATALVAARIGGHPAGQGTEVTGAGAGLLAVGLAAGHAPTLALVLALGGVIASGVALRAERRPVAYVAVVLFVLATWVRLAASGVGVPEAYGLPVTVPALVIGVLRGRREPGVSSWAIYGPGLTVTLVPSLVAAWGDSHWARPLLLGTAALLVTLAGARQRLQAPLVLGSATLALVALHELAPYVVQAVGALPRWLPPALAGLLLLAIGATYEQRLRDARRLRDTLARMR